MRPQRPCLGVPGRACGTLTRNPGGRCRPCELEHQRQRNSKRLQYQGGWQTISKAARAAATHCTVCGVQLVISKTDPRGSTYDHETLTVQCRRCNSAHRRNVT